MPDGSRSSGLIRQLLGFGSLPLLASLAPFLLLPIVSRVGGAQGWVAVLLGQALGSVAAVLIMFGWGVDGQAQIARARSAPARVALYSAALRTRCRVSAVAIPIGAIGAAALTKDPYRLTSVLMFLATASGGFSMAWFATGAGRPSWIARFEVGPRVLGLLVAAPILILTQQLWLYPLLLLLGFGSGLLRFHRRIMGSAWPYRVLDTGAHVQRPAGWRAAMVAIVGAAYSSAPLPLGSRLVGPGASAPLGSADKLFRYGTLSVTALGNALQSWVLDPSVETPWRRQLSAVCLHLTYGVVGMAALAVAGPSATRLLFGEAVGASSRLCAWYGVSFLALNISTPLVRNWLVPHGGIVAAMVSTAIALITGLPLMWYLALREGALGVSVGLAISECASALAAIVGSLILLRLRSAQSWSHGTPALRGVANLMGSRYRSGTNDAEGGLDGRSDR